jgi:hypothetical protein
MRGNSRCDGGRSATCFAYFRRYELRRALAHARWGLVWALVWLTTMSTEDVCARQLLQGATRDVILLCADLYSSYLVLYSDFTAMESCEEHR